MVPGVYDIPADLYHEDPVPGGSLSSTGARKLLPPSCPALFHFELGQPSVPKPHFEVGTAAHQLVLGDGPELVLVDYPDWRTNAAKEEAAAARAIGAIPLKRPDFEKVHAMADALREHPEAADLLAPGSGAAEQSLFWQDQAAGIWRRARVDWLRPDKLIDYKSTAAADLDSIQKSVHTYGYHMQAAWYLDGARELGLVPTGSEFVFIFQEKTEPYLVTVVTLDPVALRFGHDRNREAIDIYAYCRATGHWPAYSDRPTTISLPSWVERQYLEEIS